MADAAPDDIPTPPGDAPATLHLPMFPLGMVLFPTMVLPLRVFEPRYRQMAEEVLAGDGRFGVVLIERGSEVGGGDVRTDIGTIAQVVQYQRYPDGRYSLVCVGTERVEVLRWLPDAPYPNAEVRELGDEPLGEGGDERFAAVTAQLRAVLALRTELGDPGPRSTFEVADDATLGSFQLSAAAPVGPMDRQRLLSSAGPDERLAVLGRLLDEERVVLEARLALDGDDPGQ